MRSVQLLVLAAAMAVASAQIQTGILYWCNYREPALGGSPRSAVAGGLSSLACQVGPVGPVGGPFTYSNGTAYPGNNGTPNALYDINPTGCFVSAGNCSGEIAARGGGREIPIERCRLGCEWKYLVAHRLQKQLSAAVGGGACCVWNNALPDPLLP
jgi:hypothetical protein